MRQRLLAAILIPLLAATFAFAKNEATLDDAIRRLRRLKD